MFASVVISTWNRAASLARTLDSLIRVQPGPEGWELLVVDNNSSDDTKIVCLDRTGKLPLRYTFDRVPGKWGALNRVIPSARGHLLVFTDDDVDVEPGWLSALWYAAQRHPEALFFGGRVVPQWELPPPRWLVERAEGGLRGLAVSCNFGSVERPLSTEDGVFLGANMAFRRSVFERGWRFPESLGPRGSTRYPGGETRFMSELLADGAQAVWVPDAVVNHRNEASRATEAYLRKWYAGEGRSLVVDGTIEKVGPAWFGVPRYLLRRWAQSALVYVSTRWFRPASVWLPAEIQMARSSGAIGEFWRRRRGRPARSA
jgi:glycosyltransferase involved in cell wall biosynthesis